MRQLTREKAIDLIGEDWLDGITNGNWNLWDLIYDGMKGLNEYTNAELAQMVSELLDEDISIT